MYYNYENSFLYNIYEKGSHSGFIMENDNHSKCGMSSTALMKDFI